MTEIKQLPLTWFCARRAEVQNSTVVFQLNISNKNSFCASIFRPNAKPLPLAVIEVRHLEQHLKLKNKL